MAKPTDKELAKYYGNTTMTLYNYRNGNDQLKRRYEALRFYYIAKMKEKENCCKKEENELQ